MLNGRTGDPTYRLPDVCESLSFQVSSTGHLEEYAASTESDDWQEMVIPADQLLNRCNRAPLKKWSEVGNIHFSPVGGEGLTKVIFSNFRWVVVAESITKEIR